MPLIPIMVMGFRAVYRHYEAPAEELSLENLADEPPVTNTVLVLVGDLHMGVVRALRYAQSLSANPRAVHVELDPARTLRLEERWAKRGCGVPLVVLSLFIALGAWAAVRIQCSSGRASSS